VVGRCDGPLREAGVEKSELRRLALGLVEIRLAEATAEVWVDGLERE
jgi:hypothetical protein